jgi:hypothetical protein
VSGGLPPDDAGDHAAKAYTAMHAEQAWTRGDDPRDSADELTAWMLAADPAAARAVVRRVIAERLTRTRAVRYVRSWWPR